MVNQDNGKDFKKVIKTLEQIIDALGEFKNKYDKKFNFSKLISCLNLPESQISDIISLILNFQDKFNSVFKNYYLLEKRTNDKVYLVTKEKPKIQGKSERFNQIKIKMKKSQARLLSDIVYTFQRVNKGQGFDLSVKDSELLKNLACLNEEHPYLFKSNGNGTKLIYPSKLGLELGNLILSYNKVHKEVKKFKLDDFNFEFI